MNAMAGYSGTPLPRKLGIKPQARVGLVRAPADFSKTLGDLPDGVAPRRVRPGTSGAYDVIVCFATSARELETDVATLKQRLDPAGGLWVAWPKKKPSKSIQASAAIVSDLDERKVRACGLGAGLVDNKVCAIDDAWSGLRFVVRIADRVSADRSPGTR